MTKINERVKNSRVSYQGRDIVLDYERKLHYYDDKEQEKFDKEGIVPCEMFPYGGDIKMLYPHVDETYGVIKLDELLDLAKEALEEERE